MRSFSDEEKEVLEILDNSHELRFESLLISKVVDMKVVIDYNANTVTARYRTEAFQPSPDEMVVIRANAQELYKRIYLAVTLVNYFEKEGLIGLLSNQSREEAITLGDENIIDNGVINALEDETIKTLLLGFTGKLLIVTSAFNEFVENGYTSKDEKRQKRSLTLAWIGVAIAIGATLISSYYSYKSASDTSIQDFKSDYNAKAINADSLFERMDNITKANTLLNEKVDSLISIDRRLLKEARKGKGNPPPKP